MNKSAIEKMVEWLEEKVNPNNNEILSNADHLVVETYHEALKKAISLLAEEQAQKHTGQDSHGFGVISVEKRDKILKDLYRPFPSNDKSTAPAGLVDIIMEEVIAVAGKEAYPFGNKDVLDICHIRKAITNAVSRYRPSTQADIVGELKELILRRSQAAGKNLACCDIWTKEIEEIIAKHEGENK